jgi:predicted esterase
MLKTRIGSAEEVEALSLNFRILVPESISAVSEAKGLVLLVHGRAGNFDVMWVFARPKSVGEKIVFLAPQAPIEDQLGGYSWWKVEGRSGGVASREEMDEAAGKLENFLVSARQYFNLPENIKTVTAGFSQGAGTVCSLAFKSPELFEGVGLLAGFVPQAEQEVDPKLRQDLNLPEFFMASGTEDKIIPIETARKGKDYIEQCGAELSYLEAPVGHKVSSDGIKALNQWLAKHF